MHPLPWNARHRSHGRRHQLSPRDPTNGLERPGHGAWEMLFALEHNGLSADTSGVLGGANRKPTVEAMQSLRETPEDCKLAACERLRLIGGNIVQSVPLAASNDSVTEKSPR